MSYVMANPLSKKLGDQVFQLIAEVRKTPSSGVHTEEIADVISQITEASLHFYFVQPLELMNVGSFGKNLVLLGINTGLGLTTTTVRKLFKTLSKEQLLQFTDWVEAMVRYGKNEEYILACPVSAEEAQKIFAVVKTIRTDTVQGKHTEYIVRVIVEMSEVSLHFFAISPLDFLNIGNFGRKIVNMAVNTGVGLIRMTAKKLIHKLPERDLLTMVSFMEGLLCPIEAFEQSQQPAMAMH
ncbi:hypothetical protein WDW89_09575 [Deltaproteobacteria bacterium TL4]